MLVEPIFDQIRSACKSVAQRAAHVRIDTDRISRYAAGLPIDKVAVPELDATCHYLGHEKDSLSFLLVLDTINFGSGYFPHLRKRPGMSGYFTTAASLNDYYREKGPLAKMGKIAGSEIDGIQNQQKGQGVFFAAQVVAGGIQFRYRDFIDWQSRGIAGNPIGVDPQVG